MRWLAYYQPTRSNRCIPNEAEVHNKRMARIGKIQIKRKSCIKLPLLLKIPDTEMEQDKQQNCQCQENQRVAKVVGLQNPLRELDNLENAAYTIVCC
jgi:hypothetical protein